MRHTFFFVFSKTAIEKTHLAKINECFFLCPFSISPNYYLIRNCITVKFTCFIELSTKLKLETQNGQFSLVDILSVNIALILYYNNYLALKNY